MSLLLLSLKLSTYHQTPDIKLGLNSLLIHSEITKTSIKQLNKIITNKMILCLSSELRSVESLVRKRSHKQLSERLCTAIQTNSSPGFIFI